MYRIPICSIALLLTTSTLFAQNDASDGKPADEPSYSIGISIGRDIAKSGGQIDLRSFVLGFRDGVEGNQPALSDEAIDAGIAAFQKAAMSKVLQENAAKGASFLAANAKKQGVKQLASGLQYEVIKQGDGPSPKLNDTVRAHYEGKLIDGTVFDSSFQRGEPADFPVNGVIPGWTEALQLMKVGDKWRLFIPHTLAYGERGARGAIGPNETLIFEVELLGVQ